MNCPQCNHTIKDTAKFCNHCGAKIEVDTSIISCPICHHKIPADSKFCPDCGCFIKKEELTVKPSVPALEDLRLRYDLEGKNKSILKMPHVTEQLDNRKRSLFSKLFPVWGITLGETSMHEILDDNIYHTKLRLFEGTPLIDAKNLDGSNGATIWCFNNSEYFNYISITHTDDLPSKWKMLGFDWSLSYNDWMSLLTTLGFVINKYTENPTIVEYRDRYCLDAEIHADSPDGDLHLKLHFSYGNRKGEGCSISSKNSIYSIKISTL